MIILLLFCFSLFVIWAWSAYTKRAMNYLGRSDAIWDRLYETAKLVLADRDMPKEVIGFAVGAIFCAGCGCLTAQILRDRTAAYFRGGHGEAGQPAFYRSMSVPQKVLFGRLVTTAIYYDSLRAPFMGFLLRRLVLPWLSSVVMEEARPPIRHGVTEIAASTRRAMEARPEGKRAFALGT